MMVVTPGSLLPPTFHLMLRLFLRVCEHLKKNVDWPTGGGDSEWQAVLYFRIKDKIPHLASFPHSYQTCSYR